LIKILPFSFDAITLSFFIEGEKEQPIQLTLSSLHTSNETTKPKQARTSTRQQRRPIFESKYSLKLTFEGRERSERPSRFEWLYCSS